MAIDVDKLFEPAQLKQQASTLYSCTSKKCRIDRLTFTNTSGSAVEIRVYLVPSGKAASADNILTFSQTLQSHQVWACDEAEGHVLKSGDTIQASCTSDATVTAHGSGTKWS